MPVVGARVAVHLRPGHLGEDVLVQRAPKGHIDELQPPAHAKNGFARLAERFHHRQVVQVAHTVAQPLGAQRLLAISAGPHVGSAVHDHAIQPLGIVGQGDITAGGFAGGAGHHHHHRTAGHDPVRNRLLHILQRLASEQRAAGVRMREAGREANFEAARCRS